MITHFFLSIALKCERKLLVTTARPTQEPNGPAGYFRTTKTATHFPDERQKHNRQLILWNFSAATKHHESDKCTQNKWTHGAVRLLGVHEPVPASKAGFSFSIVLNNLTIFCYSTIKISRKASFGPTSDSFKLII